MRRTLLVLAILSCFGSSLPGLAGDWPGARRRVVRPPRGEAELRAAHDSIADQAAIVLPPGIDFEVTAPAEPTVEITSEGELRLKCRRHGVFTMGSEMTPADSKQLPFFSGGIVRGLVNRHFLSIQARVAKNAAGVPYVVDRPIVAVARYAEKGQTHKSTEIIDRSATDIRSHGFLAEDPSETTPPRTLVVSIRTTRADSQPDGTDLLSPHIEYVFLHGRKNADGELAMYGFGTTHYRSRLHCFTPVPAPSVLNECAIQGTIVFTAFAYGGQYPKANATRSVRLNESAACNLTTLDAWIRDKGLEGEAWDHLPLVFDAMIDGVAPNDAPPSDKGIPIIAKSDS